MRTKGGAGVRTTFWSVQGEGPVLSLPQDFPFLSCHQGEDVRFASTEYHCPPRHLLKSNAPCEDFPLAVPVSLPRPSMAEGGLTSRSVNNQWRFENLTPLPGPMSPWVHLRKGLVSQSFSHIWDRSHT